MLASSLREGAGLFELRLICFSLVDSLNNIAAHNSLKEQNLTTLLTSSRDTGLFLLLVFIYDLGTY